MTEIKVKLPDKLHFKVCEVSKINNIAIDDIIAAALAQKLFRMIPDFYLEERAKQSTGEGFSIVLSQVPDIIPDEYDRL
ncbi:MAG: toxin-antitoxin system HicB family antitoxin [Desulfobacterales bacterium]|nr:toxin-antitoxin system HicB family antitoxin [Desulfobacterales bacterium]